MGTHIGQGEFIIAAFIVRGYQNRAGKGRQYDSMSYVFTGGTGTDIILNQSIVIMTLKGLVSITVFFFISVAVSATSAKYFNSNPSTPLWSSKMSLARLFSVVSLSSRTDFAPVSNQKGYLYKLQSVEIAKKQASFIHPQQRRTPSTRTQPWSRRLGSIAESPRSISCIKFASSRSQSGCCCCDATDLAAASA